MLAGQGGAPALALEQDKKGQELSNNRLAAVRSGDVPVGAVPAAAPAPLSAAKTAGIEGQVRARNDALDSARASSETVTVESATPSREMAAQTAERKAKDESRTNESQKEVQAAGGAGSVAALEDRKADTFSGVTAQGGRDCPRRARCVRATICSAGRSPPTALCSALSIPARPGRRFRWRATSSSARWRPMIPISGWVAPPALFTILPMPANTGSGSRPWRTARH